MRVCSFPIPSALQYWEGWRGQQGIVQRHGLVFEDVESDHCLSRKECETTNCGVHFPERARKIKMIQVARKSAEQYDHGEEVRF
jgi:hypothetical protein